jgi:proteasome accessory factor C
MRAADPGWMVRLLLRLGAGARVEEPVELTASVRQAASEALAGYR